MATDYWDDPDMQMWVLGAVAALVAALLTFSWVSGDNNNTDTVDTIPPTVYVHPRDD